jgi:hypothetical protein
MLVIRALHAVFFLAQTWEVASRTPVVAFGGIGSGPHAILGEIPR